MGRFRSKLENTPPPRLPEREPTQDELDEIEAEEPCDGSERARLELENERTEREGETPEHPITLPTNEVDEMPTEGEKAMELRRRYGWG
jgi:hypothetical protein